MTSRRIISTEKTILDKDDVDAFEPPKVVISKEEEKAAAEGVPTWVILQLLAFTAAMIVGPISTYYLSLHRVFSGNSTYAGATAAMMANVILVVYVVVAFQSDGYKDEDSKKKEKKSL